MASWKDNTKVQFAVGVTLTFLLIRWLITGDLLMATNVAMQKPPEDGETKSVALLSALWPMFFDAMVIVGASAIAWAFKIWDAVYGWIQKQSAPQPQPTMASPSTEQTPTSVDSLVQGLARAAAVNDTEAMSKLRVQIRKPYALQELGQAYTEGDLDKAKRLVAELDAMIALRKDGAL